MNLEEANRALFYVLQSVAPLGTSKVSMWAINDIYSRPPYLRFRFKGKQIGDEIYTKIGERVNNFCGHLKWKLSIKQGSPNYLILPSLFEPYSYIDGAFNQDYISNIIGVDKYRQNIEMAVADVPELAQWIEQGVDISY